MGQKAKSHLRDLIGLICFSLLCWITLTVHNWDKQSAVRFENLSGEIRASARRTSLLEDACKEFKVYTFQRFNGQDDSIRSLTKRVYVVEHKMGM